MVKYIIQHYHDKARNLKISGSPVAHVYQLFWRPTNIQGLDNPMGYKISLCGNCFVVIK